MNVTADVTEWQFPFNAFLSKSMKTWELPLLTDCWVLQQPSRYRPPLVPDPAQSCEAPGVRPVQVADHQDRHGSAAAGHPGSVPLQHARLHGEENAGSLRAMPGSDLFCFFFIISGSFGCAVRNNFNLTLFFLQTLFHKIVFKLVKHALIQFINNRSDHLFWVFPLQVFVQILCCYFYEAHFLICFQSVVHFITKRRCYHM